MGILALMKHMLYVALLFLGTVAAVNPNAPVSSAVPDRLDRIKTRIADALNSNAITGPQAQLFGAGVQAIASLPPADAAASPMLDELDRDLAMHDLILGGPEDRMQIVARVGQNVTVAMHDERQWTFTVSDPSVLALPKIGVMWMRGVQGTFAALKPGSATITLEGRNPQIPGQMHATNVQLRQYFITVVPAG